MVRGNILLVLILLIVLINQCLADIFMQNPRGSNNRLEEDSAQRKNNQRLFNSQNNNRGGHNKGDATKDPFGDDYNKQYHMKYFQSSASKKTKLLIEWVNQHGLSVPTLKSNVVIQMMCEPNAEHADGPMFNMRDGVNSDNQNTDLNGDFAQEKISKLEFENHKKNKVDLKKGYHEPIENYINCGVRTRNKGLFNADKDLHDKDARHTRQNADATKYGYECAEERDYYPYWHPTYWKDIAVLTDDDSKCTFYEEESFNVKPRHECVQTFEDSDEEAPYAKPNNEADCLLSEGTWTEFYNYLEIVEADDQVDCETKNTDGSHHKYKWAKTHYDRQAKCLVLLKKPECKKADYSRPNHLGNTKDTLEMLRYEFDIPHFPSGEDQRCVIRMRYNISTGDIPEDADSKLNNRELRDKREEEIITPNPVIDIGADNLPIRLAINTNQYGRTFQDRSHVMIFKARGPDLEDLTIHNLNVRGKRGNIAQTYPALQYDFTPTNSEINKGDAIHFQWTGSNTHKNGDPSGDGLTGDDGQGKEGSDRNNILALSDRMNNYPLNFDVEEGNIFHHGELMWSSNSLQPTNNLPVDLQIQLATSGFYHCELSGSCDAGKTVQEGTETSLNPYLDNANASFEGFLMKVTTPGTYHIISTRNNDFSNRSQKGTIKVMDE